MLIIMFGCCFRYANIRSKVWKLTKRHRLFLQFNIS